MSAYKYLIILTLAVQLLPARAQDKLELGLFGGTSYYMGDLNPGVQFKHPQPSVGFVARFAFNNRIAAKLCASMVGIKGEYPAGDNLYIVESPEKYEFQRNFADVSLMGEFNFMTYDHMFFKDRSRFTPYLAAGLGTIFYQSYTKKSSGSQKFLLTLPFGFGIKFKPNQWLRLGLEWNMHKTFADDLDYTEDAVGIVDPNDPYGFGVHEYTHNNDWFSQFGLTVTLSMWPRKLTCYDGNNDFNR